MIDCQNCTCSTMTANERGGMALYCERRDAYIPFTAPETDGDESLEVNNTWGWVLHHCPSYTPYSQALAEVMR